ncbi:hypothetical protein SPAR163_1469 [Streptococcus pneumoniae GA58771]|nr:hypothetical protein SPAR163_1469 [Streptococcus pneumoniae GA58771]
MSIPFIPPKILSLLIVTVFDKKYKPFILKKRKNCQTIIIK